MELCNKTIRAFTYASQEKMYDKLKKSASSSIIMMTDIHGNTSMPTENMIQATGGAFQFRDSNGGCSGDGECGTIGLSSNNGAIHEIYTCFTFEPTKFQGQTNGKYEKVFIEQQIGRIISDKLNAKKIQLASIGLEATVASNPKTIEKKNTIGNLEVVKTLRKFEEKAGSGTINGWFIDSALYT